MSTCTIQQILKSGFSGYLQNHKIPYYYYKATNALINCRTAALGGHVQRCPHGHVERVWYNSCRHRSCPQCNQMQIEQWLRQQQARLLNTSHRHIVFTLPHELHLLWWYNKATMMDLFFKAVRDTLMELCSNAEHMGALPGFLLALHTWGRSLSFHPHIHCLITEGGMDENGQWRPPKRQCFLPARVVMFKFRGKYIDLVRQSLNAGDLQRPPTQRLAQCHTLFNKLGRKKWNVRVMERYAHGQGVATYLARYVRGGPLRNQQLNWEEEQQIKLHYRSHESQQSLTMNLPIEQFISRYLQHVPIPGKQTVRSYGIYAHQKIEALNAIRKQFHQAPVEAPPKLDWQEYIRQYPNKSNHTHCSVCGLPLQRGDEVPRQATGPPRWVQNRRLH